MRQRVVAAATALLMGDRPVEPIKPKLVQTRPDLERGWGAVIGSLKHESQRDLAPRARRFVDDMPPVRTERERLSGSG